jgi:hypothetical protein
VSAAERVARYVDVMERRGLIGEHGTVLDSVWDEREGESLRLTAADVRELVRQAAGARLPGDRCPACVADHRSTCPHPRRGTW